MRFIDKAKLLVPNSVRYFIDADDMKFAAIINSENGFSINSEDGPMLQGLLDEFTLSSEKLGESLSAGKCSVMQLGTANPGSNYRQHCSYSRLDHS